MLLPKPGSYVVAVSGGVDSMVLLHRLQAEAGKGWKFTVAHLDHGIREDSVKDRRLVQRTAQQYGLPFVYREACLGPGTSEATARKTRYEFLRKVRNATNARTIITAHHQDDLLETAIINILRGTGRKGLTSLNSHHDIERPLLQLPKNDILTYAKDQRLVWREDSTNQDLNYLRNYIRHKILPRLSAKDRQRLYGHINDLKSINFQIDEALVNQLHFQTAAGTLGRIWFNHLPHNVAREVMAAWLRAHDIRNFDSRMLERLVIAAKTAEPGKVFPIVNERDMKIHTDNLALT